MRQAQLRSLIHRPVHLRKREPVDYEPPLFTVQEPKSSSNMNSTEQSSNSDQAVNTHRSEISEDAEDVETYGSVNVNDDDDDDDDDYDDDDTKSDDSDDDDDDADDEDMCTNTDNEGQVPTHVRVSTPNSGHPILSVSPQVEHSIYGCFPPNEAVITRDPSQNRFAQRRSGMASTSPYHMARRKVSSTIARLHDQSVANQKRHADFGLRLSPYSHRNTSKLRPPLNNKSTSLEDEGYGCGNTIHNNAAAASNGDDRCRRGRSADESSTANYKIFANDNEANYQEMDNDTANKNTGTDNDNDKNDEYDYNNDNNKVDTNENYIGTDIRNNNKNNSNNINSIVSNVGNSRLKTISKDRINNLSIFRKTNSNIDANAGKIPAPTSRPQEMGGENSVIRLNVGGTIFVLGKSCVLQYPDTLLARLAALSNDTEIKQLLDEEAAKNNNSNNNKTSSTNLDVNSSNKKHFSISITGKGPGGKASILGKAGLCEAYWPESKTFFFNRSAQLFASVADFYRTGVIHNNASACVDALQSELIHWGLYPRYGDECCLDCLEQLLIRFKEYDKIMYENGLLAPPPKFQISKVVTSEHLLAQISVLRRRTWAVVGSGARTNSTLAFNIISVSFIVINACVMVIGSLQGSDWAHCPPNNNNNNNHPNASDPGGFIGSLDRENTPRCSGQPNPGDETGAFDTSLWAIDFVCTIWFTLEYAIRLWSAPDRIGFAKQPLSIIDLFAIMPFYLEMVVLAMHHEAIFAHRLRVSLQVLRILRVSRAFRVLRILKLVRYETNLQLFATCLRESFAELLLLTSYLFMATLVFGTLLYQAEQDAEETKYNTIPNAAWWSITTYFAYSEAPPSTALGKTIAAVGAIWGVVLLAFPISIIVDRFSRLFDESRREKKRKRQEARRRKKVITQSDCLIKWKTNAASRAAKFGNEPKTGNGEAMGQATTQSHEKVQNHTDGSSQKSGEKPSSPNHQGQFSIINHGFGQKLNKSLFQKRSLASVMFNNHSFSQSESDHSFMTPSTTSITIIDASGLNNGDEYLPSYMDINANKHVKDVYQKSSTGADSSNYIQSNRPKSNTSHVKILEPEPTNNTKLGNNLNINTMKSPNSNIKLNSAKSFSRIACETDDSEYLLAKSGHEPPHYAINKSLLTPEADNCGPIGSDSNKKRQALFRDQRQSAFETANFPKMDSGPTSEDEPDA